MRVGWSRNRADAYSLVDVEAGVQLQELSLEAAAELAATMGMPVPPAVS